MFKQIFKGRGGGATNVTINGVSFSGGKNVSIINGVVMVDGKRVDMDVVGSCVQPGIVEVRVTGGDIHELKTAS